MGQWPNYSEKCFTIYWGVKVGLTLRELAGSLCIVLSLYMFWNILIESQNKIKIFGKNSGVSFKSDYINARGYKKHILKKFLVW